MEMDKRIIDVSAYIPVARVPWGDSRITAGYVKLTEGVSVFDRLAGAHLYAIWQAKKPAGVYHFFHPNHSAQEQFDWFVKCAEQTCWGKIGDLVPAIDLERNVVDGAPTPAWNAPAQALTNLLSDRFGGCLVYCGQSTYAALGHQQSAVSQKSEEEALADGRQLMADSPAAWLVQASQWVPQWNADGYPQLSPTFIKGLGGAIPAMVQNYVGPLFGSIQESAAPDAVDQSYARQLCLVTNGVAPSEHPTIMIGSSGPEVALWQQLLNSSPLSAISNRQSAIGNRQEQEETDSRQPTADSQPLLKIDGLFGPKTQSATITWRLDHQLPDDAGVVDADCWQLAFSLDGWSQNEGCRGAVRTTSDLRAPITERSDYQ